MLFHYTAIDQAGSGVEGTIDAFNQEAAISSLQRRGFVISSITEEGKGGGSLLERRISLFETVSTRDITLLSRQIASLFEAQVSALRIFRLLGTETENPTLQRTLTAVGDDLQAGTSISQALSKHPSIFSDFYVNMVRAGEEAGKLDQTFQFLADYLDRSYAILTKTRNALIYPAFVIFTFILVMVLMLTLVIPKISAIIEEAGQEVPIYTKIVVGLSNFLVDYGVLLLILLIIGGFFFWRYLRTEAGNRAFSRFRLSVPYIGDLYRKLYLSRIADNLNAMLGSGIPMVRALEISASVVGSAIYSDALRAVMEDVKAGSPVSEAFSRHPEIPTIVVQMLRIGEETGDLGNILSNLAKFYQREVEGTVDVLVTLIEPIMIVALAVGVGVLLASVLIPIYSLSSAI